MIDCKITIYVKFWVRKRYPIFWWYFAPFSSILPPNFGSPLLPISRLFWRFYKKLTYVCNSTLDNQFPGDKCTVISIMTVHQPKNKKSAVFARFWSFYRKIVRAPPFFRRGYISLQRPHPSQQNYTCKWTFLEKRPSGWDIRAFMLAFRTKPIKNGPF